MTNHQNQKLVGVLAEFACADSLLQGAKRIRAGGYEKLDAFSPFPVHGIDEAIGIKRTILPFICLFTGIGACGLGVFMQWYVNYYVSSPIFPGYDFYISGKPLWSLPANVPVIFEVIVLCTAFAAFFGMLILNKMPQLANPLLRVARFRRVTNDRFFLLIDAADEKFKNDRTIEELRQAGATDVETVYSDESDHQLPSFVRTFGVLMLTLALVPPVMVFRAQGQTNRDPRLHFNPDMDFQTKFKPQTVGPNLNAGLNHADADYAWKDIRSARLPIKGTVARNKLEDDMEFFHGIKAASNEQAAHEYNAPVRIVSVTTTLGQDTGSGQVPLAGETAEPDWVTSYPQRLKIDAATLQRGKKMYEINCVACHGYAGDGDGLVNKRALELATVNINGRPGAAWTESKSLHHPDVIVQSVGRVFDTITNGRATMGPYGSRIKPEDRWAIVLYIQALQETRINSAEKFVVPETPVTEPSADDEQVEPQDESNAAEEGSEVEGAGDNATQEGGDDGDVESESKTEESAGESGEGLIGE